VRVVQAYRFALDPTPAQEQALRSHCGAQRFACNTAAVMGGRHMISISAASATRRG
jgi:Helix-turn-helix domain